MLGWWRWFMGLPDRKRAKLLARVAFGAIIVWLYMLGGLSLYLRARYLEPTPGEPGLAVSYETIEITATLRRPSPTLYPTITPRPIETAWAGRTLSVTATTLPTSQ